jgi:hypothetical protein
MNKQVIAILVATGILTAVAPETKGIPSLRLTQGAHVVTISDGVISDLNPTPGTVTFLGAVGSFGINVTSGLTFGRDSLLPFLDLNSLNASSSTGGTLKLELSEIGYNPMVHSLLSSIGGTLAAGATLTYKTYIDAGNILFGHGTLLSSQTFSGSSFNGEIGTRLAQLDTPFSITLEVILSHPRSAKRTSGFDATVEALPEGGATATLFGTGLLFLAVLARRHRAEQSLAVAVLPVRRGGGA